MAKLNSIRDVIGVGFVAGMRAMMPAALLSHHFSSHHSSVIKRSKLKFIQSPTTAKITKVLSALELAGDKLPNAPDRTAFPQITARIAAGALSGAILYKADKKDPVKGGLIGGAAALLATYAFFHLRKAVSESTKINSSVLGGVEDSIALAIGSAIMASRR